jgi:hypothetical protein
MAPSTSFLGPFHPPFGPRLGLRPALSEWADRFGILGDIWYINICSVFLD